MATPYLTEERLRVLGFGADLDDLSSAEARNLIIAASAKVDAWCNVPRLPQPYSFRGGVITDEEQDWFAGDSLTPAQRRIFLRHEPIKEVTALRIYVTNTQYTDFAADELFVNKTTNSIEIVSFALTSSAPLGAFVLPNIGLQSPLAKISYTYGYEFTVTDEILEATDAKQFRAVNQFWDDTTVEVKVNGVVSDPGGYEVDRTEGTITFDAAQAADAVITASYGYSMPQDISLATGLILHDLLSERELHSRGMGNVRSLKVGEISIDRGYRWEGTGKDSGTIKIPPDAEGYLAPFRYVSVR